MFVEVVNEVEGLLVGDHALVGALKFVHKDDVDVGASALVVAAANSHSVEEVSVQFDVFEVGGGGCVHVAGPEAHVLVLLGHYCLIIKK